MACHVSPQRARESMTGQGHADRSVCYHWPRKNPPPTDRAAERAVAELQREHNMD